MLKMLWLQPHFYHTLIPIPPSISWSMPSNTAVGAVLQQQVNDDWQSIFFFSRFLSPRECKYSTFDRVFLATFLAVKHFQHHLHNPNFHILTDHKPPIYAINSLNTHPVADALLRMQANVSMPSPTVPISELAQQQHTDVKLQSYLTSPNSLNLVTETFNHVSLICDISTGNPRPFVPSSLRPKLFASFHNLSHPGVCAAQKLIKERFVWSRMNADVRDWTKTCTSCQRLKIQRHTRTPLHSFPSTKFRFAHVHLDIVGPLQPSRGYR